MQILQLVNHLRKQGFFVGVGLTKPFSFEGARRCEQADALIEAMEDIAHLVVRAALHSLADSSLQNDIGLYIRYIKYVANLVCSQSLCMAFR